MTSVDQKGEPDLIEALNTHGTNQNLDVSVLPLLLKIGKSAPVMGDILLHLSFST